MQRLEVSGEVKGLIKIRSRH